MLGTLLAVPLGLASGYSIYRANFAPETNCQNLRAGIIAMLDKNVDAATRHMLVRRDVETFERSCGAFDPDAKAAFKRLLAVDRARPVEVKPVEAKPQSVEAKPQNMDTKEARKGEEPRPAAAKQAVTRASPQRTGTARAEPAPPSDTAWLSAVRDALVTHGNPEIPANAEEVTTNGNSAAAPAASRPLPAVQTAAPVMAPALPAPRIVAGPPPQPAPTAPPAADHPVPPAPIVGPQEATTPPRRSTVGAIVDNIPFLGPVVDAVSGR